MSPMTTRIGINGFGRIGRLALRIAQDRDDIEIAAVNSRAPAETQAHLLKYDSAYGTFGKPVAVKNDDVITVDGTDVHMFHEDDPAHIPWNDVGVTMVLESTGAFRTRDSAAAHLQGGVQKVILSAPAKGAIDATFCMGVNHTSYDPSQHHVVSNASCTTNCLAPVAKVLHDSFGIESGLLTTIHSYTSDQRIIDKSHKDLRRARAAAQSMIPTTTGAAEAVGLVIPELAGKMNGLSVRIPTLTVSLVDFVAVVKKSVTIESVNKAFTKSAQGDLSGILGVEDTPLVSSDFKGDIRSAIVDMPSTDVVNDTLVKVLAWYDNEYGYAARCLDLISYMATVSS